MGMTFICVLPANLDVCTDFFLIFEIYECITLAIKTAWTPIWRSGLTSGCCFLHGTRQTWMLHSGLPDHPGLLALHPHGDFSLQVPGASLHSFLMSLSLLLQLLRLHPIWTSCCQPTMNSLLSWTRDFLLLSAL